MLYMKGKLKLEIDLKPKILPQQILFSNFISFSTYSLIEYIKKQAEDNPFFTFNYDEDIFEKISYEVTIQERLIEQLNLLDIPEKFVEIGKYIIYNLEKNGYFKMSINEVANIFNADFKDVENVLSIIQSLEPAGVGARDLRECLLIQAKRYFKDNILVEIIEKYWDLLIKRKFKTIAKKMKVEEKFIKECVEKLKKLNPNPISENVRFKNKIIPEGKIEKTKDGFRVYIEDKISPFIKIESDYDKYLKDPLITKKEKDFIKNKIKNIRQIIEMLEKRRIFLEDVFNEIVNYQKEYFKNGTLLPLREKDIANKKNVSISTISRAINGKYLISPIGIINIKNLFTPEFKHSISNVFIQDRIKEIIKNEKRPLSDREIAEKLGYLGIKISSRTVNKYRNKMGILNSYLR
ncbi:MAG: RNA polymerase factor sigma-54 [Candidatus Omnitrophica bacterium]|nr:RNA polymerase factor sigma-54 [Candidatus Omnitrophota bacterium]